MTATKRSLIRLLIESQAGWEELLNDLCRRRLFGAPLQMDVTVVHTTLGLAVRTWGCYNCYNMEAPCSSSRSVR